MRLTRILAAAALALVAFTVHFAVDLAYRAADMIVSGLRTARDWTLNLLAFNPARADEVTATPRQRLVAARSMIARTLKRQPPTIESSWRMVPST